DEVRAQVLRERLDVVLPDGLVDAESWEHDVSAGPDRRTERESVPDLGLAPRGEEEPVPGPVGETEPPMRGVVQEPRIPRRQLVAEHALEQLLGDERGRRRIVP